MSLLISNIRPVQFGNLKTMYDVFSEYAETSRSDGIKICTGFVSVDSIVFLLENIRRGNINACELVVGMHATTGITRRQFDVITSLDNELRSSNKGWVKMCTSFPFHGKTYTFWKDNRPFAAIVGSSNLDGLLKDQHYEYEVDVLINDTQTLADISRMQIDLAQNASKPLADWTPVFITQPVFPPNYPGVEEVPSGGTAQYWQIKRGPSFLLELKTEEKSNLNVTFGKGRENTRTRVIRPRPWYEVEIIVGSNVTSQRGYPTLREFQVVTNDGYTFWCQTQGDYSKNFRSRTDLKILGMWIKGQMEAAGALQVGQKVTPATLRRFGKTHIKLSATTNPDLWLIELV